MTTKAEVIDAIADRVGLSKSIAGQALDTVVTAIADGLRTDGHVKIGGLGTFEKKHMKERNGRNPATGAAILIPASIKIAFKPASDLKSRI